MTARTDRSEAICRGIAWASAALVALIGGTVIAGWLFDIAFLKSILPTWVTMKVNTAVCFLLAAAALGLRLQPEPPPASRTRATVARRRAADVCALLAAATGLLTLLQYSLGVDFGIDQLLASEAAAAAHTSHPGRMAPNTALNFLLFGAALVGLDIETRRGFWPAQHLIVAACAITLLAFIGHVYGVASMKSLSAQYTPMALHTATAFAWLGVGGLCARPGRGVMKIFFSGGRDGATSRRLLLAAVVMPIFLGWLYLTGARADLYRAEFGLMLMTLLTIVLLLYGTGITCRLNQATAAGRKLQHERDRLFDLSIDMLAITGFDGYFKQLNPACEKTLGWTKTELLAKPFLDFVHPDDREATIKAAGDLAGGHVIVSFDNRYLCRDGSYKWLSWNSFPLREESLIIAIARDITERKNAESAIRRLNETLRLSMARLEAANKELEAFSYSVSHDLRAPLRHISGFLELLQAHSGTALDDQGRRYVGIIADASLQMGVLIDNLLAFARMGRAELRKERVALRPLAEEAVAVLTAETQGRRIEWTLGELPEVEGDRAMLRQALANLLGNAVKYTRPRDPARIEVGAERRNGEMVIRVRDNGVGFDMRYAGKLFGVFQRLHNSDEFEGTGIGLANVRRIVARHGGRTWAEGEPEKGATFYFSLPAPDAAVVPEGATP